MAKAVAAAATDYTPAQGEANNRQFGHTKWNGLDASIEVAAGGTAMSIVPARLIIDGLLVLGAEFFFNKQMFPGQPITNDKTDDWWNKTDTFKD